MDCRQPTPTQRPQVLAYGPTFLAFLICWSLHGFAKELNPGIRGQAKEPSRSLDPGKGHQDQLYLPAPLAAQSWLLFPTGQDLSTHSHRPQAAPRLACRLEGTRVLREGPGREEGEGIALGVCGLRPISRADLPRPALTRGACGREPVGGGAARWHAHISPQLSRVLPLMQKPSGCPQQGLGCRAVGQATGHAHLNDGFSQSQASIKAHPKPTSLLLWLVWTSPRASGIFFHSLQASSRICRSSASPFLVWLAHPLTTAPSLTTQGQVGRNPRAQREPESMDIKMRCDHQARSTRPALRMRAWWQREQLRSTARLEWVV